MNIYLFFNTFIIASYLVILFLIIDETLHCTGTESVAQNENVVEQFPGAVQLAELTDLTTQESSGWISKLRAPSKVRIFRFNHLPFTSLFCFPRP